MNRLKSIMFDYNSISFKIILGFLFIVSIVIFTTLYISFELRDITQETKLLNKGYFPYLKYLSKIETNSDNDKQIITRFINDDEYKSSYAKIIKARYRKHPVNKIFKDAFNYIEKTKKQFDFFNGEKFLTFSQKELVILSDYYSVFMESCVSLIDDSNMLEKCEVNTNKLNSRISYLLKKTEDKLLSLSTKIENRENNTAIYHLIFTSISIILIIIIGIISVFSLYPIKKLIHATSVVKEGDYSHNVKFSSKNEIGVLANSFNDMVNALQERELQIKAQSQTLKEHHKKELEIKNRLIGAERLAAIGKLSAQIAHEIRNPLNSITLNVDIIEDELSESSENPWEDIKPIFKSIKKEIARLAEITEGYLQLSKKPKIDKKLTNITKLINDITNFLEPEFKQKNIISELILEQKEHIFAEIDENKIKQVLLNIIKNAIEATSSNNDGKITINLFEKDKKLIIKIIDNGIGISEKDIKNLFQPFFTTKNYGTGLGLFLVKEIIEEHGGDIICESSFGKGASFTIII